MGATGKGDIRKGGRAGDSSHAAETASTGIPRVESGDPRATTGAVLRQGPIMEHGVGFKRRLLFHGMPWPRPAVVDEAAAAGDGSGSDASVPHEQGSIDVGGPDAEGPQE